jgi:hypothetical protein
MNALDAVMAVGKELWKGVPALGVGVAVWARLGRRREAASQGALAYVAVLRGKQVLWKPVFVENPKEALISVEEIGSEAARLWSILGPSDKLIVQAISSCSREARDRFDDIWQNRPFRDGSTGWGWNRFEWALNQYRTAIRPPVEHLCRRHKVPEADWPRIVPYRPGFESPPGQMLVFEPVSPEEAAREAREWWPPLQ